MVINFDYLVFNRFYDFILTAPLTEVYVFLFKNGGWLIFFFLVLRLFWIFYHYNRIGVFLGKFKWVFLAVDIPKGNEQTPKAVEQIFSHLAGAHKDPDLEELYLDGYMQPWFSFEIVSVDGYIQFIIGSITKYRDLVEASIYAQYPDAEITEIEDYAKDFPSYFPDKEYTLWGTEYILTNAEKPWYPIRTYREFEHPTAEAIFKDPMAALLETFSRLGRGEFAGLQILVKPISNKWKNWKEEGMREVQRMIGHKEKGKETAISKIGGLPGNIFDTAVEAVAGFKPGAEEADKKDEPYSLMLHLPPGFKTDVEAVEGKISKICFASKIRFIYLAKKEVYSKNRVAYGVTGAIKQFIKENLNGLKPDIRRTGTHVHYFFKETRLNWRRSRLVNNYKYRSRWRGASEFLLNIEELASIWHFPMLDVKTPTLARTEARRAQPPISLPTQRGSVLIKPVESRGKGAPPVKLPV